MADDYYTSAQLIQFNESDLEFDVSDVLNDAPVLAALSAFSVPGTQLLYMKQTADPSVGFRALNDGVDNDVATYSQVSVDLAIADASFNIDIAAAEGYRLGAAAFIALQMRNHMQAMMAKIEDELINGDNGSNGFASLSDELDAVADETVISAGGTTADTGSSVYLIRSGFNDTQVAWGNEGVIEAKDTTIVRTSGSSAGTYPSYYTAVTGYCGLIYGSSYSAGRIANITEDSGKGLTDALIAEALSKFPAGRGPNMLAMNRRSLFQLQNSRTATNATGAPAPYPAEAFGVPIIVTDQISSTEALIS
jgi:hypothetical protein